MSLVFFLKDFSAGASVSAERSITFRIVAGSLRKQGLSPIVQQNQEFSIQNEDFPALPGFKGAHCILFFMVDVISILSDY